MIDPKVLERHGLKPDEYDRIVAFMGREPNLTELGIFRRNVTVIRPSTMAVSRSIDQTSERSSRLSVAAAGRSPPAPPAGGAGRSGLPQAASAIIVSEHGHIENLPKDAGVSPRGGLALGPAPPSPSEATAVLGLRRSEDPERRDPRT